MQIESENEEYPYIWFSIGIDHSNPYDSGGHTILYLTNKSPAIAKCEILYDSIV